MDLKTRTIADSTDEWSIPWWLKAAVTFFALSAIVIVVRSQSSFQESLFGLSTDTILLLATLLLFLLTLAAAYLWGFPKSPLAVSLYWLIRSLRELICVIALLGILALLTVRAPLFSVRGGIPLANLSVLFLMGLLAPPLGQVPLPLRWMQRGARWVTRQVSRINSIPAWILSLAVALLPILVICVVIYIGLRSSLANYGPYSFWNDETAYWLWVRSFSHVGLDAGYNAPNELIAPAAFNHYGEGSPLYIYIYGTLSRWIGWTSFTPLLINFALLAVSIFSFTRFTRLEPVQILVTGLLALTTWPVLLYLPMTTHETLNQVIGFLLAIVFFRLLSEREKTSRTARAAFILLVYLAALIRLSWGLLLIPVIFYALPGSLGRRLFLAILLGLGLYASAILVTGYLVPPVNNSVTDVLRESLTRGPQAFLEHISFQFFLMFRFRELNPNIAVLFQMGVIITWNLARLLRATRQNAAAASIHVSQSAFEIYSMATLAAAGLLLYLQEGFYRTFAPAMLMVYLLQVVRRDYRLLTILVAINLVFFYSYMTFYGKVGDFAIIRSDFTASFPERDRLQAEFAERIVFDRAAQSPWCNTLLLPLHYYDYRLTVLPPGIGLSYILEPETLALPVKSHYLLLDPPAYELLSTGTRLQLAGSFGVGDLYYNLDSGCTAGP